MKSSAILKKARKLIKSGEDTFVCCAVEYASKNDKPKGEKIVKFISDSIHPHYTLDQWLDTRLGWDIYQEDDFNQRIRQTRLNWIDHMIELYKANND